MGMSIVLWVQVYAFRGKLNTRIIYFKSIPSFLELKRSFFPHLTLPILEYQLHL